MSVSASQIQYRLGFMQLLLVAVNGLFNAKFWVLKQQQQYWHFSTQPHSLQMCAYAIWLQIPSVIQCNLFVLSAISLKRVLFIVI